MRSQIRFSPREIEVIRSLARGSDITLEQVAEDLGLHLGTVKDYTTSARLKLGVKYARELPYAYQQATGENPFPG